jgi:hypothetical protein
MKTKSAGIRRRFFHGGIGGKPKAQKATATAKCCAYIRRQHLGIVTASGRHKGRRVETEMGMSGPGFKVRRRGMGIFSLAPTGVAPEIVNQ